MPEALPFQVSDAGRAQSRRPRQANDCTVRALALACGMPYDEAYAILAAAGRSSGGRFQFSRWLKSAGCPGFSFAWQGFPAVRGQRRMNPYAFAGSHPEGRFILKTAHHVLPCIRGVLMDTHAPASGRCVYGAWRVDACRAAP